MDVGTDSEDHCGEDGIVTSAKWYDYIRSLENDGRSYALISMGREVVVTKHTSGFDVIESNAKKRKYSGIELSGIWIDELAKDDLR